MTVIMSMLLENLDSIWLALFAVRDAMCVGDS